MDGKRAIDPIDKYVGERVRAMRLRRCLTQSAVGKALGVSHQQVQKYETGSNRISPAMLNRAAQVFGVGVVEFFPSPTPAEPPHGTDLHAIPGGGALAKLYAGLSAARRSILLGIAEELARDRQAAPPSGAPRPRSPRASAAPARSAA